MNDNQDQQQQQPSRLLYFFSLRWGTYCGISTITFLAFIIPVTRFFAFVFVFGYFLYMVADTYKMVSSFEQQYRDREKSLRWSIIINSQDFIFFMIAVIIGIFLGVA